LDRTDVISHTLTQSFDCSETAPNALGKPPSGAGKTPSQIRAWAASRSTHTHERSEVGFTQMLAHCVKCSKNRMFKNRVSIAYSIIHLPLFFVTIPDTHQLVQLYDKGKLPRCQQ
jgi:hypothetical protein